MLLITESISASFSCWVAGGLLHPARLHLLQVQEDILLHHHQGINNQALASRRLFALTRLLATCNAQNNRLGSRLACDQHTTNNLSQSTIVALVTPRGGIPPLRWLMCMLWKVKEWHQMALALKEGRAQAQTPRPCTQDLATT